jgi:uncharacterized damage-inducible protein DinB
LPARRSLPRITITTATIITITPSQFPALKLRSNSGRVSQCDISSDMRGKDRAMTEVDEFRYPIGRFKPPAESMPAIRAAQIETLRQLPANLRAAVAGLNDSQLDTPYREGGWTVRQVVHHLADSHANAFIRFKLALTEDWPTVKTYDEAAWAKLPDSALPIDGSLVFVEALHDRWVALLRAMTEEDFLKGFNHPEYEYGRQNLARTLATYEWHSRHHTAHITSLRQRQGW